MTAAEIRFTAGTVEVLGLGADFVGLPAETAWDPRSACHRAPGSTYADLSRALTRLKIPYEDRARRYDVLEAGAQVHREPRPYQREALRAWREQGARGVVVL